MSSPRLPILTVDQQRELRIWAETEGRNWKTSLSRNSWERGIPARDKHGEEYPTLYGLRNSHGATWLANYILPKKDSTE